MEEKIHADIYEPFPNVHSPQLRLSLATCDLTVRPGNGEAWVTGTYDDLGGSLPLRVEQSGSTLHIAQHETLAESLRLEPHLAPLDLVLGKGRSFGLTIEAGLEEGKLDLGGLPLTRLDLKHSQGTLEIVFRAPNPQPMEVVNIVIAAGRLEMRGLANANFASLKVEGGQADCLFDFSGALQRSAQGRITIPQGSLEIDVLSATAARIMADSLTGTVEADDGFTRKGGAFWTHAALTSQSPLLTLRANVLMGTLHLCSH